MAPPIGPNPGGSARPESIYRIFDGILGLKDWSKEPSDNTDRAKKLGNQQASAIGILVDFDDTVHRRFAQDGDTRGGEDVTFVLEPDNLLYRKHEDGGQKIDRVWALRMICDHNEKHNEKENRSTPIIDQRDSQHQGTSHEVFWIKDVGATSEQIETIYSAAGEWIGVTKDSTTPTPTGAAPKYHTTWNFYKKAGYVTDGTSIGQLKHLFKIIPFTADVPTGTDVTIFNELAAQGLGNSDGDLFGELSVWSDIMFYESNGFKGPLGIDHEVDGIPKGKLHWGGLLWSSRPGVPSDQIMSDPSNPDNGKKETDMEDSPEFGRKNRIQWLRPWIRVDHFGIPGDGGDRPPADFPTINLDDIETPRDGGLGGTVTEDYRGRDLDVVTSHYKPLPLENSENNEGDVAGLNVIVNFATPTGGYTTPFDVEMRYYFAAPGETVNPGVLDGVITHTIDPITYPGSETEQAINFFVPGEQFADSLGGKIFWCLVRPSDPGGDTWHVIDVSMYHDFEIEIVREEEGGH